MFIEISDNELRQMDKTPSKNLAGVIAQIILNRGFTVPKNVVFTRDVVSRVWRVQVADVSSATEIADYPEVSSY